MTRRLRIPQGLPTWQELGRRVAAESRATMSEYDALNTFTYAAYGAIGSAGISGSIPVGAGNWATVPLDTARLATPRGITYELGSNGFRIDIEGIYALSITASIEHNVITSNSRTFALRVINLTDVRVGYQGILIASRNADATNYGSTVLFEATDPDESDLWNAQVGEASESFSGVVWTNVQISISSAGPFLGDLGDI